MIEVVHPLLNSDEARAIQRRSRSPNYRRIDRIIAFRVFGAILVTRQIKTPIWPRPY